MSAYIYGVGTSQFGKQSHRLISDLAWDAVHEAMTDADVTGIEAVFVGTVFGEPGIAQRVLRTLGIVEVPVVTIENACASGSTAFQQATMAVQSGQYDCVLALGVEQMSRLFAGPIVPETADPEGASGLAMPAMYALAASRYEAMYGLTAEQLAAVSVKNHRHANGNQRAHRRESFSIEEVLASRLIADPLTVLQCSPVSDGAAAAVVGSDRHRSSDVRVRASTLRSGALWDSSSEHVWGYDLIRDTASATFDRAGIGVEDIDVFEVHDAFTIGEIVTTEAVGIAELGEGGRLAADGGTSLGGKRPVNPSGGLLARGHPLGATGLAQIAEIAWQLTERAGPRQVPGARLGFIETMGGGVSGLDGNACVTMILESSR